MNEPWIDSVHHTCLEARIKLIARVDILSKLNKVIMFLYFFFDIDGNWQLFTFFTVIIWKRCFFSGTTIS